MTALGPPALLETASNSLLQIRSLFRRFDAGALCCALVCAWRWPLACSLLCHVAAGALWGDAGGGCWLVSTLPCWHCTPPTITWSVPCASTQSQDTPNDAVPQPLCADGNGTITKDEFEQAYREMFVDEPDWVGRGVGQAESHRSCAGVALRLAVLRSALTAALPALPSASHCLAASPTAAAGLQPPGCQQARPGGLRVLASRTATHWNCSMLKQQPCCHCCSWSARSAAAMHDGAVAWCLNGQWCGCFRDGNALCSASVHVCLAPHLSRISRVSVMDTAAIASRCRSWGPFAGEAGWYWMDCCRAREPSIGG